MRRLAHRVVLLGLSAWVAVATVGKARAQTPGTGGGTGVMTNPANGAMLNPYMNPYANPFLNPALTVGTTNRNDALMYLWSAQQQPGALLGPRIAKAGSSARPAEMPRSAMQPGSGAAKYFNRGPSSSGADVMGKRYQRYNRYYSHNGR